MPAGNTSHEKWLCLGPAVHTYYIGPTATLGYRYSVPKLYEISHPSNIDLAGWREPETPEDCGEFAMDWESVIPSGLSWEASSESPPSLWYRVSQQGFLSWSRCSENLGSQVLWEGEVFENPRTPPYLTVQRHHEAKPGHSSTGIVAISAFLIKIPGGYGGMNTRPSLRGVFLCALFLVLDLHFEQRHS